MNVSWITHVLMVFSFKKLKILAFSQPSDISAAPVNSEWEEWTQWSACSASCGIGISKTRSRDCQNAEYGGTYQSCQEDASEEEVLPCQVPECVIGKFLI